MRACVAFLAAAAIAAAASGPARAATIPYATGFEAPDFVPGPIGGQSGWSAFSISGQPDLAQVTTAAALGGSQSLGVDASAGAQTGGYFDFGAIGPPAAVLLSGDIMTPSAASTAMWQFALLGPGLVGFAGGIDWVNGQIMAITAGFPVIGAFAPDVWHHVEILAGAGSSSGFQVILDGSFLGTFATCGDNGPCAGAPVPILQTAIFDTFGGLPAPAMGFLDNVRVDVIIPCCGGAPEPTTWTLLVAGFGLAGAGLRRRRHSAAQSGAALA